MTGGAVENFLGTLTVANTVITLNSSNSPDGLAGAAGIQTSGTGVHLTISDSSISLNVAAAPSSGVPPECSSSFFAAVGSGGGVGVTNATVDITRTSIIGNVVRSTGGCAFARGGGIFNVSGNVHLNSVVLRGNVANGDTASGGAIYNRTTKGLTVDQSTITDNAAIGPVAAGGGINNPVGSLATVTNTVVARNRPDNCNPAIGTCGP